ncbi:hypothetical protein Avbf_14940 [Armadillidium vulgare]|nr:hypothetical protein Avbf_14940 [Armadillidium vulgare]
MFINVSICFDLRWVTRKWNRFYIVLSLANASVNYKSDFNITNHFKNFPESYDYESIVHYPEIPNTNTRLERVKFE